MTRDSRLILVVFFFSFLLGFLSRGGVNSFLSKKESSSHFKEAHSAATKSRSTIEVSEQRKGKQEPKSNNYVKVRYDSEDPFPRLEALEKAQYSVPGYAFANLVPYLLDDENHISSSMSYLMGLSDDEEQQFNVLLDEVAGNIKQVEGKSVSVKQELSGGETLVLPAFPDSGNAMREALLERIETDLGYERRQLFEMILINQPAAFGNYGQKDLALRNPQFELVNGHRKVITLEMGTLVDAGTKDERFEGIERAFSLEAFKKRFGHLYKLDLEE